jgi:L-lysine exporter family protein LysE/ArgO
MPLGLRLVGRGIALGLGAAAPIGPVNVEIARRTFRNGFPAGFALGCGAVTIDVTYAVLSSLSLRDLLTRPAVLWPVTVGGIAFLFYLAFLSLRGAVRDWRADPLAKAAVATPPSGAGGAYLTGLLMTLLNPMTIGFWFLAVPAALGAITQNPTNDLPMICAGVFIGTIGWVFTFAGTLAWAGRWRRGWWLAAADAIGGGVLFCFGMIELWRTIRPLL